MRRLGACAEVDGYLLGLEDDVTAAVEEPEEAKGRGLSRHGGTAGDRPERDAARWGAERDGGGGEVDGRAVLGRAVEVDGEVVTVDGDLGETGEVAATDRMQRPPRTVACAVYDDRRPELCRARVEPGLVHRIVIHAGERRSVCKTDRVVGDTREHRLVRELEVPG